MPDNLIALMKTMFCLNRWNVQPRMETWTEAENIALCCHLVYSIGRQMEIGDDWLNEAIKRTLVKSINKHLLSDIPVDLRDKIRDKKADVWEKIVNDKASEISKFFPAEISASIKNYLTYNGDYEFDKGKKKLIPDEKKKKIEDLVRYAQLKVAMSECDFNKETFGMSSMGYQDPINEINEKIKKIPNHKQFEDLFHGGLFYIVRKLKHVRRWNRLNRFIESSVLAHTFLVTFLALIISEARKDKFDISSEDNPQFHCLLYALFHDIPEAITGDIITPVKDLINRYDETILDEINLEVKIDIKKKVPELVEKDIDKFGLLEEPNKETPFEVSSLIKDCDTLAALLECSFEMGVGNHEKEIKTAFDRYYQALKRSEWDLVRELSEHVNSSLKN